MKRFKTALFAAMLCMGLLWQACALPAGEYSAPIVSLTTKAPIPAIKKAFSKAFGEAVQIEARPDGKTYMTLENRHMTIHLFGNTYEANVMTVAGAEVVSEKRELFSDPVNGILAEPQTGTQTVPAAFRLPLQTDADGVQVLTITVDFMDKFMGKGDPHPTDVTLTLGEIQAAAEETTLPPETTEEAQSGAAAEETHPAETAAEQTMQITQTAQTTQTAARDMPSAEPADDPANPPAHASEGSPALVIAGAAVCLAAVLAGAFFARQRRRRKK